MRGHVEIDIENDAQGLSEARRVVRQFLHESEPAVRSSAALLMSELVTNALMYGDPPVSASLDQHASRLRIAVSDTGHESPFVRPHANETGGYGLRIVDTLCERWGCDFSKTGKTVWCEVPVAMPRKFSDNTAPTDGVNRGN